MEVGKLNSQIVIGLTVGNKSAFQGKLKHIFRIDRNGEEQRWLASRWIPEKMANKDNRRLLWHGSPPGSIMPILKTGLKITSMADIYFSEMLERGN